MAEKHLRKCLTSLAIREMQIKTTLRFHLTPVRMVKIKNSDESRCCRGCEERGTLLHCLWSCKLAQPLRKSVWQFLRKLDIVLSEDPAMTLLGKYPQEAPTSNMVTCLNMFITALFQKKLERTQMSFNRGIDTEIWYIYTEDLYTAIKNT